jgi:hypothetical protein
LYLVETLIHPISSYRCGVNPGDAAVVLAKLINVLPGITFKGIQPYNGYKTINMYMSTNNPSTAGISTSGRLKIEKLLQIKL